MTLEEAILFLQSYIKESAVPKQKHISPDLVSAEDLLRYEEAMKVVNDQVLKGLLSREELLRKLGLS